MDLQQLSIAMIASVVMVLSTVLIHYEALSLISRYLHRLPHGTRRQIIVVIIGIFFAHTLEVILYTLAFMLIDHIEPGLSMAGAFSPGPLDYFYFSTVSYTSLGLGDIYPIGSLRLLTGVEALNGLLLIGWSASFTYLVMQRRWTM